MVRFVEGLPLVIVFFLEEELPPKTFKGDFWFSCSYSTIFDSLQSEPIFFNGELLFLEAPAEAEAPPDVVNEAWILSGLQNYG